MRQLFSAAAKALINCLLASNVAPDDYGTTVVTYEEQCRGWLNATHRAQTSQTRITAYAELKSNLAFFSSISVWEFDVAADAEFVRLGASQSAGWDTRFENRVDCARQQRDRFDAQHARLW